MATEIIRPNAAGDECNIDDEDGAACPNHYQNVDEVVADDNTTRNKTKGAGWLRDFYNLEDHSVGSGTINKITVYARCKCWGAPDQIHVKIAIKSGTGAGAPDTPDEDAGHQQPYDTWQNLSNEWATNPATVAAWTWDEIDALQAGISMRTSENGAEKYSFNTQLWVVVDYTAVVVPTVTTQAVSDIAPTTATSNQTITDTGGENCDKRGACWKASPQLEILRPNAAGDECNIDRQSDCLECPNHYTCVDDVVPDDLGTFVVTNNVAAYLRDLYNIEDSGGSGTISKITVYARVKPTSAGRPCLKIAIKTGGTAYESSEIQPPGGEWSNQSNVWAINPKTEVAWTWADIDALQIGIALRSGQTWIQDMDCTQVYVEVEYTPIPTIADSKSEETDSFGTGAFTRPMTGLSMGTKYCVRGYAHNSAGYNYGNQVEFDTLVLLKSIAGVLTSVGAVLKMAGKNTGQGYVSFSGVVVAIHTIFKSIAGALTSAGAIEKIPTKMLSGVLSSSGAFEKLIRKMPAGTLTSAGSLVKDTYKSFTGALTSAGALNPARYYELALSGVLNFTGEITALIVAFSQACAGTLNMAGSLSRNIYLNVTGTLSSAGATIKMASKNATGRIWYLAGGLSRNIYKSIGGTLTSSGSLAKIAMFFVEMAGTLGLAGGLVKTTSKALLGVLTSTGAITKWVRKYIGGTVTLTGAVTKYIRIGIGGALNFIGRLVPWKFGPPIEYTLSFEQELDMTLAFEEDLDMTLTFEGG